jgi:hypothetical protein
MYQSGSPLLLISATRPSDPPPVRICKTCHRPMPDCRCFLDVGGKIAAGRPTSRVMRASDRV